MECRITPPAYRLTVSDSDSDTPLVYPTAGGLRSDGRRGEVSAAKRRRWKDEGGCRRNDYMRMGRMASRFHDSRIHGTRANGNEG